MEDADNTLEVVGTGRAEESKRKRGGKASTQMSLSLLTCLPDLRIVLGMRCAATNAKDAPCGNPAQAGSLACWIQSHQDQIANLGLPVEENQMPDDPVPPIADSDGAQTTAEFSSKGQSSFLVFQLR